MRLTNGQRFPEHNGLPLVGGGTFSIPRGLDREWTVLIFYRGYWCWYSRQQLSDFQLHLELLHRHDVGVVALSVDEEPLAAETVDKHGLTFPVVYGLSATEQASRMGAYVDEDQGYLQMTNFILRRGTVVHATYSSGPLGQLRAETVARFVKSQKRLDARR